jgi:hypothetical protein
MPFILLFLPFYDFLIGDFGEIIQLASRFKYKISNAVK